jgi:hypothetical protein
MFIFTLEDIIGLSLLGLFALAWLWIYVENVIWKRQVRKRKQQQGDL